CAKLVYSYLSAKNEFISMRYWQNKLLIWYRSPLDEMTFAKITILNLAKVIDYQRIYLNS
ncbi:hypothetical protein, partial [Arsenophonus sp. ENCA]|uniref:hypothetical protein n=1 Tax=Arsenophonus sp. ENCA TaxID=1987579 RepID=UPI0025B9AA88